MPIFRSIGKAIRSASDGLSKFNETIHGSADEAAKTVKSIKSGASGAMTARGIKDCVVSYQCNDMVCFAISAIGTTADISNHICGNVPAIQSAVPIAVPIGNAISVGCKSFVYFCRTGKISFSCNDPL